MNSALQVDRQTLMALAGEARLLSNPPGQIPPGALAGERVSRQQGRGLNFDSLRRYQPGDDVRLIDWQATARLRSPWIRMYNEERERPVFLIVDQRLDMFLPPAGKLNLSQPPKLRACSHGEAGTMATASAARCSATRITACKNAAPHAPICPQCSMTCCNTTNNYPNTTLMKRPQP